MNLRALFLWIFIINVSNVFAHFYDDREKLHYKQDPAPDGHRCGLCPTYFQKICAFDHGTNSTFIFDNHCIMDLYNCVKGTEFIPMKYEHCLYFGNFGYVHGYKYEDMDYGEDHFIIKNSKKNPDFIRRVAELTESSMYDLAH